MASSMSWEDARDRLRKIREEQQRANDEVVEIWEDCLCDFSYKLGDELWLIYEQVCIAACDCGRLRIAAQCIEALRAQFPKSLRVLRLQGMACESGQKYEKATQIYDTILTEDPNNTLVRKRKIAMLKAQNKIEEAIKDLNNYLQKFMGDYDAWNELCDLYLTEHDFQKAAFCMEELMMSNPHNHSYHQKYAEIKYTQGDMVLARRYFSQAIKLNPSNMRALYGLFLSAGNIAASKSKDKKDNIKYAAWAAEQISKKYQERDMGNSSSQQLAIESMLDDLQITQST